VIIRIRQISASLPPSDTRGPKFIPVTTGWLLWAYPPNKASARWRT